jgi:transposase-like protein
MPRKASPSKRQKFPPEYKLEAVRLSSEGTKSVAAQLGIDKHQLYRWLRAFERSGNSSFPGNGKIASQDEELHQLRRQLKVVTEERRASLQRRGLPNACVGAEAASGRRMKMPKDRSVEVMALGAVSRCKHLRPGLSAQASLAKQGAAPDRDEARSSRPEIHEALESARDYPSHHASLLRRPRCMLDRQPFLTPHCERAAKSNARCAGKDKRRLRNALQL